MSIYFDDKTGVFHLDTRNSSYQLRITAQGVIEHLYYGPFVGGCDMSYLRREPVPGFSSGGFAFDTAFAEYTGAGLGDFRVSSLALVNPDGSRSADLRFQSYTIRPGRYDLPGMPGVRDAEGTETLIISCKDHITGLCADLMYSVYPDHDVITRAVCLHNDGEGTVYLEKAASVCLDFSWPDADLLHFPGRYCFERQTERVHLAHGVHTVGSRRGVSSHHENPFVILCDRTATEDFGNCCGCMLVYSGNHKAEIERTSFDDVRLVMGIHDENFRWVLRKGEVFYTPEVILSWSGEGLGKLSRNYHRLIREHVCPPQFRGRKGEVLLNSWEAAYFDYTEETLLEIAKEAASLGVDRFVLDDGWFGRRNSDTSSLGDWQVNRQKLPGGLKSLAAGIRQLGLSFGLWIEPEMINEDSDLYRAHPDWVLRDPGRVPEPSRNQLVLDMSRKDVRDYLYKSICSLLEEADITYLKWDFNRPLMNVYSAMADRESQGELGHRFILGTYELLRALTERWPDVMIEGCTSGGGRFDAAMLYFCPQIWCSDNTDAVSRLRIQEGTSYGYPSCAVGSHVSAVPNHQTGRSVSLKTRSVVAMSGTYGFELDPRKLSPEEKDAVRSEICLFRQYENLIREGLYYRLGSETEGARYTAWAYVSEDRSRVLLNAVGSEPVFFAPLPRVRLKGLDPDAQYKREDTGEIYTGAMLMYGGFILPFGSGDYPAARVFFKTPDV